MIEEELGTFFLTDFLARHFDRLVIEGLGLDRFPQLRDDYFGHYRSLVYLAQTEDPRLTAKAEAAAERLGLAYERRFTGLGGARPISCDARARMSGASMASLTILYWRDIPSQVIVKAGRKSAKRELSERFIRAIDAAAMRARRDERRRLSRRMAARRSDRLRRRSGDRGRAPPPRGSKPNTTMPGWRSSPNGHESGRGRAR